MFYITWHAARLGLLFYFVFFLFIDFTTSKALKPLRQSGCQDVGELGTETLIISGKRKEQAEKKTVDSA